MPERVFEYDYTSVPTIRDFSRSDAFMRALVGPFGSGKSSGCVIDLLRQSQAQEPGPDGVRRTRHVVVRNTYSQLQDTTIKTFHDWLPPDIFGAYEKSYHNYTVTAFPGVHMEIMFRALDRPDHVAKLLSAEYTSGWVNEAREVPWAVIEALQGRVGRYPARRDGGATRYGIILDTNPPDSDSEFYRHFESERPSNAAIFHQPSGRSPEAENLPNLPPNYYQNLAIGKDPDFIKVYIDGLYGYVRDGKPVYPEFNDTIHVGECQPITAKPIRRGWDFGLTPACTFSQMLPSGQWIVFDELTADSLGIDRFSDQVLSHIAQNWGGYRAFEDYGDPAGNQRAQTDEKTCFEILRGKGINIQPGEVSDSLRIEAVKKPLNHMIGGKPAMLLHPRCKMLRKGFIGKYRYRRLQGAGDRYTDKPEKNEYSHPHDALQYDASRLFGGVLRNVETKMKPIPYPKLGLV